jgi:hypothetical protein
MAGQPEVVDRLEMVSGRDASLAGDSVAEEVVGLEDRRRGREQPGAEVERGG